MLECKDYQSIDRMVTFLMTLINLSTEYEKTANIRRFPTRYSKRFADVEGYIGQGNGVRKIWVACKGELRR